MSANLFVTQNNINTDIPIEIENGGTGAITFTQNGIVLGNGTNPLSATAELADGQLLVGSTGNAPVAASLTAGAGIQITNGAGSISIAATGQKLVEKVTANTSMVENFNYITNGAGSLEMLLPATIALGAVFTIVDVGAGFRVTQGAGQQIIFGNKSTTAGTSGNLQTTQDGSSLTLMCTTADTEFAVISSVGNFRLDVA
jgi:hypothetical protein